MRNELVAALRNALERGSSLQKAKESLINAGYNPQEVSAAAEELTTGVSEVVFSPKEKENVPKELPPLPPVKKTEAPKSDRKMIIALVILISLVFVAGASFLIYSILK